MGFVVPSRQPAAPNYLNPPNAIRATTIDSILQLDRYCFATRRNLIASLSSVTTNYPRPNPMFVFDARTSKNSNGNVWVIAAGVDIRIEIVTAYSSVSMLLTGGTIADAQLLTGIPADDWITIEIEIASAITPALGTMRGLYLVEEILDAADLP
jgi:hypothetical protein